MAMDARRRPPTPIRQVLDDTSQLRDEVEALTRHVGRTVDGWRHYVTERLDTHPYATVTIAAGVGLILGGGIPRPLLSLALAVGSRIAVDRVVAGLTRATTDPHNDD